MAGKGNSLSEILDQMAVKIMMVEPGDLSVVGDLVNLVEELASLAGEKDSPLLARMAGEFHKVLGQVIMAELPDSPENFEALGRAIGIMQEVARKGPADELSKGFAESLGATGYVLSEEFAPGESRPAAPEAKPPAASAPAEVPAATPDFLQDTELLSGFIEEAFEHLESIESNILELENNPGDSEIINNIFRPFHTIKGVSGFLNLMTINKLAHTTENLLDDVRNGSRAMDPEVIDVVLSVGDTLRSMVENVQEVLEEGPDKFKEFDISEYIDLIHTIQGKQSGASPPAAAQEAPAAEAVAEPVAAEETPVEQAGPAKSVPASTKAPAGGASAPAKPAARAAAKVGASIRVDIEKLDGMVNAVGELVIMQAMVRQNPLVSHIADPKLNKDFSQLSRITSELQKTAMSMRMVPIRQTFQKMVRLVRDLSKKSGKLVDLVMSGEETEIDRNMVDSIYDPLVHMIRNSVDHGVQAPEERKGQGKNPTGTVRLSAYQKGGNIVIEIVDDGHGLNTAKIREKAIARGLIRDTDNLSDHELNNLIFLPGFSTADKITDVSGRGVGMDVVKKGVEKLRGKVEVISQPGEGTQFVIRLPLTLAIIDGIIVRVGSERYIIPTIAIQESIRPRREHYNTVHGRGEALMVRDRIIPIVRLGRIFGVESEYDDPCEAIVVVVENEGRLRALMVDELLGKQEVVIKSLGGYMKDIRGVAGGTILGDGRVGLILDLAGLIAVADLRKEDTAEDNKASVEVETETV